MSGSCYRRQPRLAAFFISVHWRVKLPSPTATDLPKSRKEVPNNRERVPKSREELPNNRKEASHVRERPVHGGAEVPNHRARAPNTRQDLPNNREGVPNRGMERPDNLEGGPNDREDVSNDPERRPNNRAGRAAGRGRARAVSSLRGPRSELIPRRWHGRDARDTDDGNSDWNLLSYRCSLRVEALRI